MPVPIAEPPDRDRPGGGRGTPEPFDPAAIDPQPSDPGVVEPGSAPAHDRPSEAHEHRTPSEELAYLGAEAQTDPRMRFWIYLAVVVALVAALIAIIWIAIA